MDKSGIQTFACYTDPATLGPRWTRWLTSFELYADGKGLIIDADATAVVKQRRRALLLHLAGPDVQDVFQTLPDTGEVTDYAKAVTALNTYFVPKVNSAYARQTFHKLCQETGETVQQFSTRLRRTARDCGFQADTDNQIRDAILNKCTSSYVRRKLLEEGDTLTLARTLELASQCERIEEQMAAMSLTEEKREPTVYGRDTEAVHRVAQKGGKYSTPRGKTAEKEEGATSERKCFRCGCADHMAKDPKCPARGQTCHKCNGKDHYAKMCRSRGSRNQNVNNLEVEHDSEFAFNVKEDDMSEKLTFCVGGVKVEMLVDSGAKSNVMGTNVWEKLKAENIKCNSYVPKEQRNLYPYSSSEPLPIKGMFECEITIGDRSEQAEFIVIKGNGEPLLGRKTAMKLGVLKIGENVSVVTDIKDTLRQQYPKVFKGVGKLKTKQLSLYIDPKVKPVAQPLRRIPYNLREAVENKIKELTELDIIECVKGPTPWVNPLVISPKPDNDIRLCLDMRRANEAIITSMR